MSRNFANHTNSRLEERISAATELSKRRQSSRVTQPGDIPHKRSFSAGCGHVALEDAADMQLMTSMHFVHFGMATRRFPFNTSHIVSVFFRGARSMR
jgi:hypothetical protein